MSLSRSACLSAAAPISHAFTGGSTSKGGSDEIKPATRMLSLDDTVIYSDYITAGAVLAGTLT
jgi:hypothetical protein